MLGYMLILVLGVLGLRWLISGDFAPAGTEPGQEWGYLLLISALVASWVVKRRGDMGRLLSQVVGWVVVVSMLVLLYGYRHELAGGKDRFLMALMPGKVTAQKQAGQIQIMASSGGHFRVTVKINGASVPFMVDTGASAIVLAPHVASRIGLDPDQLRYTQPFNTANGRVYNAPVRLDQLQLGGIHMEQVPAVVNQTPMGSSLLGMTFFNRLKRYQVDDGVLTLFW
ncbi:retropepsin-like aspartic protease family protein [Magnetococcus sp. PR-3]|uniref:retropepsin-like aspartic protease family protein n=1 Tax=Magnetococcus sp. PR-3 TaxID=3120355 RepID=UPI002FCE18C0